jgi:hypothetical protein
MRRPHFPRDDRPFDLDDYAPPGFTSLWVRVLGIAALLGFLAGLVWIVAHLVFGYRFGGN